MKINDFCYEYKIDFHGIEMTFVVDHYDQRKRVKKAYMLMYAGVMEERAELIKLGIKNGARAAVMIQAMGGLTKYVRQLIAYTTTDDIEILRRITESGEDYMSSIFLAKNPGIKSRLFVSQHWQETIKIIRAPPVSG